MAATVDFFLGGAQNRCTLVIEIRWHLRRRISGSDPPYTAGRNRADEVGHTQSLIAYGLHVVAEQFSEMRTGPYTRATMNRSCLISGKQGYHIS